MKARALTDLPGYGVKAGQFFEAPESLVAELVAGGSADDKAEEAAVYGEAIPPAVVIEAPVDPNAPADDKASKKGK